MTIYALGTSHTYGECQGSPDNKINHPWPSIMSERLGVDVINYGRTGVNNLQLIEMAQHLCENNKPDMIIAEMRWLPFPILIENHQTYQNSENLPHNLFSDTRHNKTNYDKYRYQYHSIFRSQVDPENESKKPSWLDRYPEQISRDILGYARINFFHNILYNQQLLQALGNMHHLSTLCKFYNVPAKVFVWAGIPFNVVQDANLNLSGLNTFEFFKSGKPFRIYAETQKSLGWIKKHECPCGHMDQDVHEYFVDTVIDEVKQLLTGIDKVSNL